MSTVANESKPEKVDVCVYGGTSAGVIAATQVQHMGHTVVLISPTAHLGGLTSGGLGFTDMGDERILGGLARDYFHRVWAWYQDDSAWNWEPKSKFSNKGQHGQALNDQLQVATSFEPHVAESIFMKLVQENKIEVVPARLDLKNGVIKEGARITGLRTEDGRVFQAAVFIDATYEGDLMAKAGVSYVTGREPNSQYGEANNGIQTAKATINQLPTGIDPYVVKGDPKSGLLPGVNADAGGPDGAGDAKIQSYCYRMCLTDLPANRVEVTKPDSYRESDYELLFRAIEQGQKARFFKLSLLPNRKTDSNNDSGLSTDLIGFNYDYPEADYAARAKIEAAHRDWQLGLIWTLQHSPRVPEAIRESLAAWGLPKDEFADTGHFPPTLYVREARRMLTDYVVTENLIRDSSSVAHSIGMGAYTLDSHNTQRYVDASGPRPQRRRCAKPHQRALQNRLRLHRSTREGVHESARAGLRLGVAHRVWLHPHGASVHDPGPECRDGGRAFDRRQGAGPASRLRETQGAARCRWAGAGVAAAVRRCREIDTGHALTSAATTPSVEAASRASRADRSSHRRRVPSAG